ncbi:methyltransferase family protein [Rhodopirellula sp. SWK7]|uniref:methyltransferase family protein n=1 Tax=Rhodopirellula sp. SWK7 TaxID=595460 RepID=UPI0002BD5AE6|nr:isoprenylcysteine carboxylmethyltransferase family protein [Rhodopirellula sp. SWK7]EMI45564.1 protein-S-isoprenylcysteine O-methyltransferase [Rhodopirellula sp. SWK7]
MNARKIVASYFIVQAIGVLAWWGLLVLVPGSVQWFQPEGWPEGSLLGFWLSDLVLLIGGSLVVAEAVAQQRNWATTAVWALAIAICYPTLYCIGVSVLVNDAWLASAMMVSMAGVTFAMATIYGHATQTPATIRVTPMNKRTALAWTFTQTFGFWCVFLWIVPKGIVEVERRIDLDGFQHAGQSWLAMSMFVTASALGGWSGYTMATVGLGTPLPTATAPSLVVAGPYRFVRNPMALAGILQGIAVGWFLGSVSVIAYSLCGAVVWHLFVRPIEEADLRERFTEGYREYCEKVWLWLPVGRYDPGSVRDERSIGNG